MGYGSTILPLHGDMRTWTICCLPARITSVLPKGESGEEIKDIDKIITKAEAKYGFEPGSIKIMVSIESPKGLRNAYEIASASPRMIAIAIGGEDFAASIKTEKTKGNPITGGQRTLCSPEHDRVCCP